MSTPPNPDPNYDDALRPHSFDGIHEYDKRLPNWWLLTFYATIAFSIGYWFYYRHTNLAPSDEVRVESELARIQAAKLASGAVALDDDALWKMSRDTKTVQTGLATFQSTCMSCHGPELKGGIGPNLVDQTWLRGGRPVDILNTVTKGTDKGMPAWGPVLGSKKITEVVAFILSKHESSEPGMSGHASSP